MIEVSSCVICDGAVHRLKRAVVAPFLARRIWNRDAFLVDLVRCEVCGFIFYNPRLEDADLHLLYANYRLDEYLEMRHAFEPWYAKKMNEELASPESYKARRAKLTPILKEHIGKRKIRRILDHGGDRGDLVAGLLDGAEPYVYDISGVNAAPGVNATNDPAACHADLIINSNVLEHVGFPRQVVSDILRASPAGGLVYLEVPCELPFEFTRIMRRIAQMAVVTLARPLLARHMARPAGLYMMHEHINYYTEQTLATLMRASGGTVFASGRYTLGTRPGDAPVVWCLGSPATIS